MVGSSGWVDGLGRWVIGGVLGSMPTVFIIYVVKVVTNEFILLFLFSFILFIYFNMTSEFDGADLNNDSYQIDTAIMDPNIAYSAPADNDEAISALTSQSSPAAEDLASGHSKGGPKKDPAWTLR